MPAKKRPQATFIMNAPTPLTPTEKTAQKASKARQSWVLGVLTLVFSIILHLTLFAMIAFGAMHTEHWPWILVVVALTGLLVLAIDDVGDRIVKAIRELRDEQANTNDPTQD